MHRLFLPVDINGSAFGNGKRFRDSFLNRNPGFEERGFELRFEFLEFGNGQVVLYEAIR
ncbi:hypothetical protein FH583_21555 (plasmid) [Leptospira interrogans]|uniref:hypothetical protein n=1 Tax=Leptospira interrogans TaxID=173 RepID=UPI001F063024|nr:hypothetical protein [Leptospira interrogans]UML78410.1 hypothetical protein FH583_21705 [Leptospira interrogans]UML78466.1 hypothetical protein FH583_21555 [Leptospira interrogans]